MQRMLQRKNSVMVTQTEKIQLRAEVPNIGTFCFSILSLRWDVRACVHTPTHAGTRFFLLEFPEVGKRGRQAASEEKYFVGILQRFTYLEINCLVTETFPNMVEN